MSIQAIVGHIMSIAETPPANTSLVSTPTPVTFDGAQKTLTLNSVSTPPVTKQVSYQVALSTGAVTIDLTNMAGGANGATVSFSGLKVATYLFWNPATNANAITLGKGNSNGYDLFGSAQTHTINPGERLEWTTEVASQLPTVGSGAKTLDLTGTGSQALYVQMTAG